MSETNDGGPAFPLNSPSGTPEYMPARDGMSLRDYFAGQALAMKFGKNGTDISVSEMATYCYQMADAMLKARTPPSTEGE